MSNRSRVPIQSIRVSSGPAKKVIFPRVKGIQDEFVNYMNSEIVKQTQQLIDQQVGNMPSSVEEMYGEYEIKNNQRQVLSLTLSNYTYHVKAAHGMTFIKSLTFDLKTKRLCKLEDLFKPGSDYINNLSKIIQRQIDERQIPLISEFKAIQKNQDFYIADKSLVIYFQLYDLTPYVFGFPMFPISVYEIQDIINENGPLGRLAENN